MPTINRDKLKASICKDSYAEFLQAFWDTVIPDKLVWSGYLQYQCDVLQETVLRACRGEDKEYDLLANVPTGTGKSSIYSVFLTPWVWTNYPRFWCLGGSYSEGLAFDHGRMSRDVCKSDLYRKYYPHIEIREDADTKGAYINTLGGARYGVGRGGSVQGKHFHVLIIDDPLNPKEAVSDAALAEADYWIRHTLSGRKRGNKMSVPTILVMQRLAESDPSGVFLQRKKVKHIRLPATTEYPINPPELVSLYQNGLLDPVRLPLEFLDEERSPAVLGEDGFCTPGHSPVLMANLREKAIEDVKVGDEVVGYVLLKGRGNTSYLKRSKVVAKSCRTSEVVKLVMESGREVYCTPDHQWWTQRAPSKKEPHRRTYDVAKVGSKLHSVYEPWSPPTPAEQRLWDWLGGFIDGEGACRYGSIAIHQSPSANPWLCRKLQETLDKLDIPHKAYKRKPYYYEKRLRTYASAGTWVINGGRSMKIKIVNLCRMFKKAQIIGTFWKDYRKIASGKDRVVAIRPVGRMKVYGLTTETGNYVVWGYASKNCGQYGQSPVPAGGGKFKVDRLKTGPVPHAFKKVVRSWDKASTPASQSKLIGPAFSVGTLMGLDQDNRVWVLDIKRQRIDTFSREQLIRQTAREDQAHYGYGVVVVIEQEAGSGGTDSAMGTLRRLHGFSVRLSPASGSKESRAEEFSVRVNAGLVYLPQHLKVGVEWVGWAKDWTEELKHFPYSRYKDQVDSAAHGYKVLAGQKIRVGGLKPKAARQAARAQAWGARLQIARGP
jgi:predicted phage terminase large subunit-like protein